MHAGTISVVITALGAIIMGAGLRVCVNVTARSDEHILGDWQSPLDSTRVETPGIVVAVIVNI